MKKLLAFLLVLLLAVPAATAETPICVDLGSFRVALTSDFYDATEQFDMEMYVSQDGLTLVPVYQDGDMSQLIKATDEETFATIEDTLIKPTARVATRLAAEKSGGCYKVACVTVGEENGFTVAAVTPTSVLVCIVPAVGSDSVYFAQYLVEGIFVK